MEEGWIWRRREVDGIDFRDGRGWGKEGRKNCNQDIIGENNKNINIVINSLLQSSTCI